MKPRPLLVARIGLPLATAILALLSVPHAQGATFYWDNNGSTLGFGNAGGTWAQNNTSGGTSARWKTDPAGLVAGSATQTTANTDIFNFGTPVLGLGAGTIAVSGSVTMGDTFFSSASGAVVLSGGTINFGAAKTITVNNASNTINSVIGGAATSLTKAGTGTLIFTGANTYTGATIINGGTLNLGGGTANGSLASTVLTLGGGTLSYTRTGGTTEAFTTTNINGGGTSNISVVSGNTINLGTVNRGAGGYIDLSNLGAGSVDALAASNDSTGIMGGLTFGDTWAVANGAGSAFTGLANGSFTQSSVALDTAGNYSGLNIDVNSSQTPDAAITANSLRFSSAAASTLSLQGANVISSGGILVGSGVGGNLSTITGGTLAGAASKDLSIIQNNISGGLVIASEIADNTGATALTKSGAGTLTLTNSNTFTGGVFLNSGRLVLGNAGAFNSTTPNNVSIAGGTLALSGNNLTIPVLSGSKAVSGVIENGGATNATLTISSSTGSEFAGILQDGAGSGTLALAKSGSGSLTLSGPSTYTGGTTVSGGTVFISNATSFGTGAVSVTGASKFSVTGGVTYVNAIDVGAALTLQVPAVTLGTATYSGQLTGSSDIAVEATLVNGVTGTHAFTNTNNTFTGSILMPIGSTGTGSGNDFVSFNSIGDGGTFTFRKRGHTNAIIHTGSSAIEFDTRQIALSGDFGGLFDGGGTNPVNSFRNNAADAAHTITFNTDLTPGAINTAGTFFFGGSNTGNNTFAGDISNPTSGGNLGIGKSDAGRWILTGENTFLGNVKISGGTLSVPVIAAIANAQPLGQGTIIEIGHQNTTGTLEFTGDTDSTTDKQVQMGNQNSNAANAGGAIILNNGDGSLTFSNGTFNPTVATVTATRTLTLGGSYSGSAFNEIEGTIQDNVLNTGRVALTVSGSKWKLSGTNTYTGATSVTGGTLLINGSTSTTSTVTVGAGGTLGGTGTVGGATTVNGTLSPGQSPGMLTFQNTLALAGSTLIEIDGLAGAGVTGGHDFVNLTGAGAAGVLTYGGSMTVDIGVVFGAGSYSWNLFDFASESATFSSITLAGQYSGSLTDANTDGIWDLTSGNEEWSFTESTGVLSLNVIPEPGIALLGGLGLVGLLRRRRCA